MQAGCRLQAAGSGQQAAVPAAAGGASTCPRSPRLLTVAGLVPDMAAGSNLDQEATPRASRRAACWEQWRAANMAAMARDQVLTSTRSSRQVSSSGAKVVEGGQGGLGPWVKGPPFTAELLNAERRPEASVEG